MGKVIFGAALAFACLGATWASATSVRVNDRNSAASPGAGGWTQNFSTKAFSSGSINVAPASRPASVVPGATNKVVDLNRGPGRYDLAALRSGPLRLRADADCIFVSIKTSAGKRWRPGCK
jgi:hypothetical protein